MEKTAYSCSMRLFFMRETNTVVRLQPQKSTKVKCKILTPSRLRLNPKSLGTDVVRWKEVFNHETAWRAPEEDRCSASSVT
jgi:hypothetical protein